MSADQAVWRVGRYERAVVGFLGEIALSQMSLGTELDAIEVDPEAEFEPTAEGGEESEGGDSEFWEDEDQAMEDDSVEEGEIGEDGEDLVKPTSFDFEDVVVAPAMTFQLPIRPAPL
jgi:hypothetical protein